MKRRFKMGKGHSKRHFTKHGSVTHKKNMPRPNRSMPMRGGIRM